MKQQAQAQVIKKIPVEKLTPGMFVHDLNCGWLDHPFLRNRFLVESEEQVRQITAHGIHELYIDTTRGLDVRDAPTSAEVRSEIQSQLEQLAKESHAPEHRTGFADEIRRAERVHKEATRIIHGIMNDVRLGQQIEVERVHPIVEQMADSVLRNPNALLCLARLRTKDEYTFQHSVSVSALLIAFARAEQMERDLLLRLGTGGLLHDVGKMQVPPEILNKPGKLSEEEFAQMKLHVVRSREVLEASPGIDPLAVQVAAQHHERFDGSGYPLGLKGEGISFWGQMAAIVDVYDAITSDRVYHKGMEPTLALRKLMEWSRFHFNEKLVHAFVRTVGIYPTGTLVRLESGRLGVVVEQHESDLLRPQVRVFYSTKSNAHITPKLVDLARPLGAGGGDRIVSHEIWAEWKLDPRNYL